jgi:signal peptidase II
MRTEDREVSVSEPSISEPLKAGGESVVPSFKNSAPPTYRYLLFAFIAASGIWWDLWSKWAVFDWLKPPRQFQVWKGSLLGLSVDFQLATTFNPGALWGIGQNQTWLFALLSFFAIGGIGYFVWTKQAVSSLWLTIASGLLLAGASGNLYDRLGLHGWKNPNGTVVYAVRDFLDFVFFNAFHWATFNFADTYLVTGAIMLIVYSFVTPVAEEPASKGAASIS